MKKVMGGFQHRISIWQSAFLPMFTDCLSQGRVSRAGKWENCADEMPLDRYC